MAPSKTFNIAGLEMSVVAIPNRQLREDYQYLLRYGLHAANPNTCGLAAAQAAYEYGEPWYRDLLSYLEGNLDYLDRALREQAPQVRLVRPQATYIPVSYTHLVLTAGSGAKGAGHHKTQWDAHGCCED